jgi:hypothetical protein
MTPGQASDAAERAAQDVLMAAMYDRALNRDYALTLGEINVKQLAAAHSTALGPARSVCLADVVEFALGFYAEHNRGPGHIEILREFGGRDER